MFYSDVATNGNRMVELQKHAQELLDKPPQWRCNIVGNSGNVETHISPPVQFGAGAPSFAAFAEGGILHRSPRRT